MPQLRGEQLCIGKESVTYYHYIDGPYMSDYMSYRLWPVSFAKHNSGRASIFLGKKNHMQNIISPKTRPCSTGFSQRYAERLYTPPGGVWLLSQVERHIHRCLFDKRGPKESDRSRGLVLPVNDLSKPLVTKGNLQ